MLSSYFKTCYYSIFERAVFSSLLNDASYYQSFWVVVVFL